MTRTGWFEQASFWVHAELERWGIEVSGPIEQPHSRPWSTVLRVPTGEGDIYFKAVSPVHPYEPALLGALKRRRPDCVPRLLSVDTGRGWVLMRDAGQRLREIIRTTQDLRHWLPVLPLYAEMQIELAQCVPELLALGVPDRRLSVLPTLYEPLLTDVDVLRIDQPLGLTCQQYGWLLDLSTHVAELCERLADHRIPETINHGDLNDGNVFLGDGRSIFIDWDDGCVSHPFYSLRTVLVSAEISLGLEENSPELWPLRDPYLEPWTRYGSREDLLRALELAGRLASINGALTWHRLVSKLEGGGGGKSTPNPCRPCCKSSSTPARQIPGRILPFDGTCARWLPWASAPGYSARVVCSVGSGRFRGAREFRTEIVGGACPEFPVMYASIIDAVPEGA